MAKISKITIGRLYNLGNFEHARYEISVEVGEGESPGEALEKLEKTVEALSPRGPVDERELSRCRQQLELPAKEIGEHDISNLAYYKSQVEKAEAWSKSREEAFRKLDELGGRVEHRDAKDNWDDDFAG